jgi:hypothetical protein
MRKYFVTFMASLLSCSAAFAFWPEAADSSFDLGVGYRRDKFSWTTQGNATVANVPTRLTSKLQWRDLKIWQIDANVKYLTCDNIYFRAGFDYGWITHGKVTEKDFADVLSGPCCEDSYSRYSNGSGYYSVGSNAVEFADLTAKADRGHVYDATIAIGYQFKMCDDGLALSPVVGYSWDGQHLELGGDGSSDYSPCYSPSYSPCNDDSYTCYDDYSYSRSVVSGGSSCSSGSRTKYNTRWNGPFLGVDLDYKFGCDWSLFATYEFHWARFHAKAHWGDNRANSDLLDGFNHRAKSAQGQVASVGIKYDFCECWTLSLVGEWKYFRANHGKQRTLVESESNCSFEERCFEYVPLKHITWQSASVTANIGMLF